MEDQKEKEIKPWVATQGWVHGKTEQELMGVDKHSWKIELDVTVLYTLTRGALQGVFSVRQLFILIAIFNLDKSINLISLYLYSLLLKNKK